MKNYFNYLLSGFEFNSVGDFFHSLIPTVKYNLLFMLVVSIPLSTIIDRLFGLDALAIGALVVAMTVELISGIYASHIQKIEFSSKRLSRFSIKTACYLILISIPYLFASSYKHHGNETAAQVFDWLHVFLVTQIVLEHILSILENLAVIQGKPKTYWIDMIKTKIAGML
jgi:hypothetical protein